MPIGSKREDLTEYEVFLGTPASAESFGLIEKRYKARDADRSTNWADIPDDPFWTLGDDSPVLPGTVFERQAEIVGGPQARSAGAWKVIGETRTPAGREAVARRYVRANVAWEVEPGAGTPMRTASGLRMFDEAGASLWQGVTGEPELSNVTGLPTGATVS